MVSDSTNDEVLSFGTARERLPLREQARRHPWAVGALTLVVLAGAVVLVRAQLRDGPPLPTVTGVQVSRAGEDERTTGPWTAGDDGRPAGPVRVEVDVTLTFDAVPAEGASVLGVGGPGVQASSATPSAVTADTPRLTTALRSTIDCSQVPMPVDPASYTVQLRAAVDGRSTAGPVDARKVTTALAGVVRTACGSWLARSDLTVSAASGTAAARTPSADLGLTVTNTGRNPAVVALDSRFVQAWGRARPLAPVTVPPGAARTIPLAVEVERCDGVTEARYLSGRPPTSMDVVGLVATVGEGAARGGATPWVEGTGATGIVLAADARRALESTLLAACGGLNPFAVLIATDGVRYDPATRELEVDLEIDGTPGRVRDVTLTADRTARPAGRRVHRTVAQHRSAQTRLHRAGHDHRAVPGPGRRGVRGIRSAAAGLRDHRAGARAERAAGGAVR